MHAVDGEVYVSKAAPGKVETGFPSGNATKQRAGASDPELRTGAGINPALSPPVSGPHSMGGGISCSIAGVMVPRSLAVEGKIRPRGSAAPVIVWSAMAASVGSTTRQILMGPLTSTGLSQSGISPLRICAASPPVSVRTLISGSLGHRAI